MTPAGSVGRMVRAAEGMSRASGSFDSALRAARFAQDDGLRWRSRFPEGVTYKRQIQRF